MNVSELDKRMASLIKWLKFAWESFKTEGLWRNAPPRKIKPNKEIKGE